MVLDLASHRVWPTKLAYVARALCCADLAWPHPVVCEGGFEHRSSVPLKTKMVCKIAVLRFVVCMWNFGELY